MLRDLGHQVHDFREHGFGWDDIDENWDSWATHDYVTALRHPIAEGAFQKDYRALHWANACVLVMPCGRSAHLEAGWSIGHGKPTCFFFPTEGPASTPIPVDLMHDLGDIALSETALNEWAEQFAFCPRCDLRLPSEEQVAAHIMREHLRQHRRSQVTNDRATLADHLPIRSGAGQGEPRCPESPRGG